MKKLNEEELAEVKGGFVGGVADPRVNLFCITNYTSKHRHNLIKWLFHLK